MQRGEAGIRSLGRSVSSTPHPTSPRSSLPFSALGRSWSAAASSNAQHAAGPTRKRVEADETQRSVARSYNVSQSTISRPTAFDEAIIRCEQTD
jgi:hypothetical protein